MKKQKSILQVITAPRMNTKSAIGHLNGQLKPTGKDVNSRKFEDRFVPRYKKMPELPTGLPEPSFSESSNKILIERYLLKGGNLEVVESVSERFWHIAYDIASGDMDFGAKEPQVYAQAQDFYKMMVLQEFLPNSPTIMNAGKQNGF